MQKFSDEDFFELIKFIKSLMDQVKDKPKVIGLYIDVQTIHVQERDNDNDEYDEFVEPLEAYNMYKIKDDT